MREIIYRDDCDLNAPSLGLDEMIHDTMVEYGLTWNTNSENDFDEDKIFEFARELIQKAQNVIDTAPTVGYIEVE